MNRRNIVRLIDFLFILEYNIIWYDIKNIKKDVIFFICCRHALKNKNTLRKLKQFQNWHFIHTCCKIQDFNVKFRNGVHCPGYATLYKIKWRWCIRSIQSGMFQSERSKQNKVQHSCWHSELGSGVSLQYTPINQSISLNTASSYSPNCWAHILCKIRKSHGTLWCNQIETVMAVMSSWIMLNWDPGMKTVCL